MRRTLFYEEGDRRSPRPTDWELMATKQNTDTSVKSATRAVDILEFVAQAESRPTFGEIGEGLGIPNSSLYYLLNTLSQRGYLVQDGERGGYMLGHAVDALAARGGRTQSWQQLILPMLDEITAVLNETSTYAERRGDEIECVATRLGTQTLLPVLRAGQRAPLYTFSGGKIVLANLSDEAIDVYIKRTQFEKFTPETLSSGKALWREIREIRETGVAYSRGEHTLGVTGMSVALRTDVQLAGALGVAIATVRFSRSVDSAIRAQLAAAANRFLAATRKAEPADSPIPARRAVRR
jgi:IclR family transcriptional regulator, acetate operon repressor